MQVEEDQNIAVKQEENIDVNKELAKLKREFKN